MDHGAPPVPRAPVHHCRRSPADAADRVPALSLRAPDAGVAGGQAIDGLRARQARRTHRSEEHTSELQSPCNLVCRLLLEKKKNTVTNSYNASRIQSCDCRQFLTS